MPGLLCHDDSPPPTSRPLTAQGGMMSQNSPHSVDYESGIEDSGDSESTDQDFDSCLQQDPNEPSFPEEASQTEQQCFVPEEDEEGAGERRSSQIELEENFAGVQRQQSLRRRTSLQHRPSGTSLLDPLLPHSAPVGLRDYHRVHMALQSALTACAVPTISVSEDVSQTESNQEDVGNPLNSSVSEVAKDSSTVKEHSRIDAGTSAVRKSPPPLYPISPSVGGTPSQDPIDIPTDFSDTNDSDPEKKTISIALLSETIVCPSIATHHQGREVINVVYAFPIDQLFTLIFTNSKFILDLHLARKTCDVVASPWQSNPETNQKIRQVTYTLTLPTNSFGPKVSHVTETQVMASFSKSCEIYTIDAEACNSGIPYADYFFVSTHWCLTRESTTETRLAVWSEVKYKKNVWGFMKSVIDKNAFSGMKSLMNDLNTALLQEVDSSNLRYTRRKRRRGGSKTTDIIDPLLQLPQGDNMNDLHKSTQIPSRKMTLPSLASESLSPPLKTSIRTAAVLFLCALLALNSFLYYRLYDLEDRVVNGFASKRLHLEPSIFKSYEDASVEEWMKILHEQEALHTAEMERWRKAVSEAADYLKKAEESLRDLHASIPHSQASKMQALLRHLQLLQQMQEKKPSPASGQRMASEFPDMDNREKEL